MAASKRARVGTGPLDGFESELNAILNDEALGEPGDRLHLATDLWEGKSNVPEFFERMRPWVEASFAADSDELVLFNRVAPMRDKDVRAELTTLAETGTSVDEEEAAEALALPTPSDRHVRLFRYLLEEADEYEVVSDDGDGDDIDDDCQECEGEDSDFSDDSAEIHDPKFDALRAELNGMGLDVILFDDFEDEESDGLAALLKLDHLLLSVEVAQQATGLGDQMRDLFQTWEGGDTELHDNLIRTILLPTTKTITADVAASRWHMALGRLLGLQLFFSVEDDWVSDNEVHHDWPTWRGLFSDLSAAWTAVLACSDEQLGLAPLQGCEGGYRTRVTELVEGWAEATNEALSGYDAPPGEAAARVSIVHPV